MQVRKLLLAATIAVLPSTAQAGIGPSNIAARIDTEGAATTVASLVAKHKWHRVLAHIGTGKPAWLAIAPRLAAGTDATLAPGLTIALADALPRNATGVLALAAGARGPLAIGLVCAAPYIKPVPSDLAYYRTRAKRAVEAVTAPALREAKRDCLAALRSRS